MELFKKPEVNTMTKVSTTPNTPKATDCYSCSFSEETYRALGIDV